MLRQSLKEILKGSNLGLPDEWGTRRPENLEPSEFLTLTALIFGARAERQDGETRVWRHARHGGEEAA